MQKQIPLDTSFIYSSNSPTNFSLPALVQLARRPLRHLVTYGSANKYRPVTRSKVSGRTAKRPSRLVYFFCATATMLTMTATVKATHSQRWVCRTHLFQFNRTSSAIHDF